MIDATACKGSRTWLAIISLALLFCLGGCEFNDPREDIPQRADDVRASIEFMGRDSIPISQTDYAAAGIIAFPRRAIAATSARYDAICAAFMSGILPNNELTVPNARRLVTFWPVRTVELAAELNSAPFEKQCANAIAQYDVREAKQAIADAEKAAGIVLRGEGPFLLAWSPPDSKGSSDVPVLILTLSGVQSTELAADFVSFWIRELQTDPTIWNDGRFDRERLTLAIRRHFEKYGPDMESIFEKVTILLRALR